jgi:hypothetical protein
MEQEGQPNVGLEQDEMTDAEDGDQKAEPLVTTDDEGGEDLNYANIITEEGEENAPEYENPQRDGDDGKEERSPSDNSAASGERDINEDVQVEFIKRPESDMSGDWGEDVLG